MENGIVVKEEAMSGGYQVTEEVVLIKQEVLLDEHVEEEVGNEDEVAEHPMIKQEELIGDEHRVEKTTEDQMMEEVLIKQEVQLDEHVEEEVGKDIVEDEVAGHPMIIKEEQFGDEHCEEKTTEGDQMGEIVSIKQEVLIGDEHVEEEVGNGRGVDDEVAEYPMIEEGGDSLANQLGDESDVLQGSIGVQNSEEVPPIKEVASLTWEGSSLKSFDLYTSTLVDQLWWNEKEA
ncbi:hypothetical protein GE061_016355 [Apolygus lucorum]|uniref:Uncharacterized protein n=1 Tax=Apolygus lucorum TaxID=248454 RepID=A0A8S9XIK5_APOLU|nr:hypothetical protein GE061_016355 [Apolygus lucorum]